ncbi:MAG: restriction endonuclease subunit S [Saprospiraceae bacterium]|nr:restriction endonuclease subunit S [Saprospiraceae bacterium]
MLIMNELPEGWVWRKLGEVCKAITGTTPPKDNLDNYGTYIPFVKPPQLFDKPINDAPEKLSKKGATLARILPAHSVLVTCIGNLGRTAINNIPVAFNQQINALVPPPNLDGKFLFYQAQSPVFKNQLENLSSATTVAIVNKGKFETIQIALPPLPVQHAIVTKIEEIFSELDHGVEQLKTARQQLKVYRQAVLKWAFEGRLTNEGVKDGELPEGWKWVKIEEIASVGTGATPLKNKKEYYENGKIAWVTSGALNDDFVNKATEFVTEKALKETNLSVYPKGTLLLAMYGEGKTRGKCSELQIEACTNQAIAAIYFEKHEARVKPFLKYFLHKNYGDIRKMSSGGVQPNLNLGIVKKTVFPFPPIEEQHLIVSEIERRLSVCDKLEETIAGSLKAAEVLRAGVLKRAFEGRLVG